MKCLSVRQPWAWAIFNAGKDVENRSQRTNYRGPLVIQASAYHKWHEIAQDLVVVALRTGNWDMPERHVLERTLGCVVGVVDLVDCVRGHSSPWALKDQWHWLLANPRRVRLVPLKGQLGLFDCDIEMEEIGTR